ncbi:tetratricopeptide repeat protein [bacterium]|nr:tetratricopeptide repeat protein [bacterium]
MMIGYLTTWMLIGLVSAGAVPPLREGIAVTPFQDVGAWPCLIASPKGLQNGLAGFLETTQGIKIQRLVASEEAAVSLEDPNAQLLPPAYRSTARIPAKPKEQSQLWLTEARKTKTGILLQGSYEQYQGQFRLFVEAIDPYTEKGLFYHLVGGTTAERTTLEKQLAEGVAAKLTELQARNNAVSIQKIKPLAGESPVSLPSASETLSADDHYENGYALTRRFDQTGEMKYLDGAIDEYRAALGVDPDHFRSLNNLGTVLHRRGNYDEALKYYEKVLQINPKYARAMENAALAYRSLGQMPKAIEMWQKALECEDRADVKKVIEETLAALEKGESSSQPSPSPPGP